jgi:hypothetical protein
MNNNIEPNFLPLASGSEPQDLPHLIGNPERLYRNPISKSIIIDILGPLIRSHNIINMILALLILLNPTFPKQRSPLNNFHPPASQPLLILGHTIVVPGCEGNCTGYVVLEGTGGCPHGGLLVAQFGTLPWEHCAFVAVEVRVGSRLGNSLVTILY